MAMRLAGEAIDEREAEGGRISDETLLVLLNALPRRADVHVARSRRRDERVSGSCLMDTEHAGAARAIGRVARGRRTLRAGAARPGAVPPSRAARDRRRADVGHVRRRHRRGRRRRLADGRRRCACGCSATPSRRSTSALRQRIHALFDPEQSRIDEVCEVNVLLGEAFAAAAARACAQAGVRGRPGGLARPDRLAPGRRRATPARRCSWPSRR